MKTKKLYISFLWHFHQPYYKLHGKYILPWTRLHAVKDYNSMAMILKDYPNIKSTFNFVPSLLLQMKDYIDNNARDVVMDVTLMPADTLDDDTKIFILKNFFMAKLETMISPYPRYKTLLDKRGMDISDVRKLNKAVETFADQDFLDLQVWFNLAWVSPILHREDEFLKALIEKGKNFTEEEKIKLIEKHIEIMRDVISMYTELKNSSSIDITTSPFYHPILPLIINTDSANVSMPDDPKPKEPFRHPDDAASQVARAVMFHSEIFGEKPKGMWPSEGSVSDDALKILAKEGISWVATDQDILFKTFHDKLDRRELYRPYIFNSDGSSIKMVFRDKVLSDLIGFSYYRTSEDEAVNDFIERLYAIKKDILDDGQEYLVPIVLDGENCWEYYKNNGEDFLRKLYTSLSENKDFEVITFTEFIDKYFVETPKNRIESIWPGSWINHNFKIWIGEEEDNAAWDLLRETRDVLVAYSKNNESEKFQEKLYMAWDELHIAEGSDWFWWYGSQHSSENDAEFDMLFRNHLINIYNILGLKVPEKFYIPIKKIEDKRIVNPPIGFISPVIDGKITSYYEWYNAGFYNTGEVGNAMHYGARIVKSFYYGFDLNNLYLRLDLQKNIRKDNIKFDINFRIQEKLYKLNILYTPDEKNIQGILYEDFSDTLKELSRIQSISSIDNILELAIGFDIFNLKINQEIYCYITVYQNNLEIEKWPYETNIKILRPDDKYFADKWTL